MPYSDAQRQRQAQHDWYLRHKARLLEAARSAEAKEAKSRSRVATYATKLAYVNEVKAQSCMDCGLSYPPCVMDLDHVRGVKVKAVSQMLSDGSAFALIKDEILKCDVVCANCHRLRTAARKLQIV